MSVSKPLITPCLWFDSEGEEAARFYTSIFPNSEILHISHYTEVSSLIWLSSAMMLLVPPAGSCLGDLACLAASEEVPDNDSGFDNADETSKNEWMCNV
jgi:hypothetical protein